MEILIILLVVVIIVGALMGGKSFGDTINKGCGCLVIVVLIGIVLGVVIWMTSEPERNIKNTGPRSSRVESAQFEVEKECQTYAKPDIGSDSLGYIEAGKEFLVENVHKYNYFYEISDENGETMYVRKDCLAKK